MSDYKIVFGRSASQLAVMVQLSLKAGYVLAGGVAVNRLGLYQAVTRDIPELSETSLGTTPDVQQPINKEEVI